MLSGVMVKFCEFGFFCIVMKLANFQDFDDVRLKRMSCLKIQSKILKEPMMMLISDEEPEIII
jgi:hypothetical protein